MKIKKHCMFGIFNSLFRFFTKPDKQQEPPTPPKPQPGEEWRIGNEDPFPAKDVSIVLEVRDGWVRYQIGRVSSIFNDERMPIDRFIKCYRRYSPPTEPVSSEIYSYSFDGENYHGSFSTRDEALAEARCEASDDVATIYTGRNIVPPRVIDADQLIEGVICSTTDEAGDLSDGYLSGVTKDAVAELQRELQAVWDRWEKKHQLEPKWFNVENVKTHKL